jgi:HlyD family secretion protein
VNETNTNTTNTAAKVRARNRARRWLPYIGGLILIALIVAGLWPQPIPVETAPVALGALRATVNEEGKTRIKQHFIISAPVAGQLRRIPFKEGAAIKAGDVLAQIDPITPALLDARTRKLAEARRDAALANLEKARATHNYTVSELKRIETLYTGKTISVQELESAQWREISAARELTAAESALRQTETELATFDPVNQPGTNAVTEIRSPISGRILRVFEESARVVTLGMPLLQIGDPADLEVVIEVLSRDGAAIFPGTKVELEQWGGPGLLQAQVRLVEPAAFTKVSALGVEEQRVRVIVDLLTPAEKRPSLGDAFRVETRIIVWETNQVLKVPSGALFRHGQDWAAYVIENGKSSLRPVQVGKSSDTEVQILSGLKEGEQVILYPGDRLKDGQRVKLIKI